MKWQVLESKKVLEGKARELRRKCRGHFYTNSTYFSMALEKEQTFTKMWIAEEHDNLMLLQQYSEFFKLYYFIGNADGLRLTLPYFTKGKKVLCELFDVESKEKQTPALAALKEQGFQVYRKFYMWESVETNGLTVEDKNLEFKDGISKEQLLSLFECFDPIVDLIPIPNMIDDYYKNKSFISCYVKGVYAGCAVYTIKEAQIDEDFIYILPEFRGIGKYLRSKLLDITFNELNRPKLTCWIHTDNKRSESFHTAAGAKRTPYYKISMLLTNKE